MVLSACSSYFEQLFVNFSEPNQIVILKDTSFLDISAIVDFMYRGEINVSQVKLNRRKAIERDIFMCLFSILMRTGCKTRRQIECNNDS